LQLLPDRVAVSHSINNPLDGGSVCLSKVHTAGLSGHQERTASGPVHHPLSPGVVRCRARARTASSATCWPSSGRFLYFWSCVLQGADPHCVISNMLAIERAYAAHGLNAHGVLRSRVLRNKCVRLAERIAVL
jgi:hypothetical protein